MALFLYSYHLLMVVIYHMAWCLSVTTFVNARAVNILLYSILPNLSNKTLEYIIGQLFENGVTASCLGWIHATLGCSSARTQSGCSSAHGKWQSQQSSSAGTACSSQERRCSRRPAATQQRAKCVKSTNFTIGHFNWNISCQNRVLNLSFLFCCFFFVSDLDGNLNETGMLWLPVNSQLICFQISHANN